MATNIAIEGLLEGTKMDALNEVIITITVVTKIEDKISKLTRTNAVKENDFANY